MEKLIFETQGKKVSNIKSIKCPNCEQAFLYLKDRNNGQQEATWQCPKCPSFYPYYYFDVMPQFEKYVERKKPKDI